MKNYIALFILSFLPVFFTAHASVNDVYLASVTGSASLIAEQQCTISARVENNDSSRSYSFDFDVYFDGEFWFRSSPSSVPYGSMTISFPMNIPYGQHTITFALYVEGTYRGYGDFVGFWSGSPNLSFGGVSFDPDTTVALTPVTVGATLQNTGNGPASSVTVNYWADGSIEHSFGPFDLQAHQSAPFGIQYEGIGEGSHTFEFARSGGPSTGVRSRTFVGSPSLSFSGPIIFAPSSLMAFQNFQMTARLENDGNGESDDLLVDVYIDGELADTFDSFKLPAKNHIDLSFNMGWLLPGDHDFEYRVAGATSVSASKYFANGTPDLEFDAVEFTPASPMSFTSFTLVGYLENIGSGMQDDVVVELYVDDMLTAALEFNPITMYPGQRTGFTVDFEAMLPGNHDFKFKVKNTTEDIVVTKNFENGTPDVHFDGDIDFAPPNPESFTPFDISLTITNTGSGWMTDTFVDVSINGVPSYYFGPFTIIPDSGGALTISLVGAYPGDHTFKYELRNNPSENREVEKPFPVTIPPPAGLSVISGMPELINVSWQNPTYAPASDFTITRYDLYSRPSGGSWSSPERLDSSFSGGVDLGSPAGLRDFAMKSVVEYNGDEYQSLFAPTVSEEVFAVSPPPVPTGVQVNDPQTGDQLDISWNAVSDPDLHNYHVLRKENSVPTLHNHDAEFYVPSSSSTYSDTGLQEEHNYYYVVVSRSLGGGNSQPSSSVMGAPTDTLAPALPTDFFAWSALNGVVFSTDLYWTRPAQNTDGSDLTDFQSYRLEYRDLTDGGSWTSLSDTLSATSYTHSFSDKGGHTLEYRLQALDDSGNASVYATLTVVVPEIDNPPSAPQNLTVLESPADDQSLVISWDASSESDVDFYKLYRKTDGGSFSLLQTLSGTSYNDRDVALGSIYTYYVTAVDEADQESDASNQDSNTPKQKLLELVSPTQLQPEQVFSWVDHGPVDIQWSIAQRYRLFYHDGIVQIEIKDQNIGEIVYNAFESRPLSRGALTRTFTWDGRHWYTGAYVSGGAYTTTLRLYARKGGPLVTEVIETKNIVILSVELTAAYSDQIPGRECNALPGQNPMYMGARADNRGYLQIDATVQPQQINNIGMVGVRHGTSILASEPIQTPRTPVDFAPSGGRELYEVVAGCDLNTDGTLQNSEVTEVMTDQLMLLTQGDYNWSRGVLNNYAIITIGVGSQLLEAFNDNIVPPNVVNTATTIASTELTHPVGASWDATCSAATRLYTYIEGTDVSDDVEEDSHTITALQTSLGQHQAEVQNYFTQNPTVNEHTFGSWNWQANGLDFDGLALQFAFGHVNVAGTVSVTVRRSDLAVTHISYTGSFTDIYDFNYTGAYPSEHGATVQAGFPTLGVGGRVFRDRVEFSRDTTNFNYDFN